MNNMEPWKKFEKLVQTLRAETVCDELEQYLSSDELEEFNEHLASAYDVDDDVFEEL